MVTDLWCYLPYNLIRAWHTLYASRVTNEMMPEIHTVAKLLFPQTYNSFSNNLILGLETTGYIQTLA